MDSIRIGVIGTRFGQWHVRTLAQMPEAHLVAIADRHPALPQGLAAYAAEYGARAYASAEEMMANEQLDAVSVCTSPRTRETIIRQAAGLGIALFVEKPWATDLDHAQRLALVCQETGARAMVAFSFRYLPAIVRLRELLEGDLGQPWLLNGSYVFDWLAPADNWLWDPANGNGFINENSCHLFDAVCSLLGAPSAVSAEGGIFVGRPSEEAAAITVRFAGGALAALTVGGIGARACSDYPRLDLITANGQAQLMGRQHIWESLSWATRDAAEMQRFVSPAESEGRTRYTAAFEHFFQRLRSGQPFETGPEAGVQSVAIAMAVYEAARSGRRVELDL